MSLVQLGQHICIPYTYEKRSDSRKFDCVSIVEYIELTFIVYIKRSQCLTLARHHITICITSVYSIFFSIRSFFFFHPHRIKLNDANEKSLCVEWTEQNVEKAVDSTYACWINASNLHIPKHTYKDHTRFSPNSIVKEKTAKYFWFFLHLFCGFFPSISIQTVSLPLPHLAMRKTWTRSMFTR